MYMRGHYWLTTQVLQDQVELVVGLECIVQANYGRMLQRERERERERERGGEREREGERERGGGGGGGKRSG